MPLLCDRASTLRNWENIMKTLLLILAMLLPLFGSAILGAEDEEAYIDVEIKGSWRRESRRLAGRRPGRLSESIRLSGSWIWGAARNC